MKYRVVASARIYEMLDDDTECPLPPAESEADLYVDIEADGCCEATNKALVAALDQWAAVAEDA